MELVRIIWCAYLFQMYFCGAFCEGRLAFFLEGCFPYFLREPGAAYGNGDGEGRADEDKQHEWSAVYS